MIACKRVHELAPCLTNYSGISDGSWTTPSSETLSLITIVPHVDFSFAGVAVAPR
jgi:hypothetical protein